MIEVKDKYQNYINGTFIDGGAGWLEVENPATGQKLSDMALANATDVDRAVQAAKACHDSGVLTAMRPVERGRMVRKIGAFLTKNTDELATLLTLEAGKPLWEAKTEIAGAARYFEYYGNQAETLEGRSIPLGENYFDFTVHEPYGVSGQIIPWNFPVEMVARSLSAGLATGNACVVKTPELTPLTCSLFANAAQAAGFPPGAVNIICGLGTEAGVALSSHPDVNQLVFTGSVPTGIAIATAAAGNVVPCVLELGGKSAGIVFPGADEDSLSASIRWGIFFHAGQVCSALSRLLVHESIYDQTIEMAVEIARGLDVAPGIDCPTGIGTMGSMVSQKQRDRAFGMCQEATRQGANAVTGGNKPDLDGWFLEPTIFTNVSPDMGIARNEVFGPVLSVIKFSSDEEAICIANGTDYGLVGGVFTNDLNRAMSVAKHMKAGQIFINEWYAGGVETPFGGYGKSGYGREKGREALLNYVQTKNIAIALGTTNSGRK